MRHRHGLRKLNRTSEHRAALVKLIPDDWALALMASQGPRFRKL